MRILLTGHRGYIGAVAGRILCAAGHEVVGLDTDLFSGCEFGEEGPGIPELRKDLRDVTKADREGFDAVVHLAALSNDSTDKAPSLSNRRNPAVNYGTGMLRTQALLTRPGRLLRLLV